MDLIIRQGDTDPPLLAVVLDQYGISMDLTGCSVSFVLRQFTSSQPIVNAPATIVDAPNGVVQYSWTATDTATAGLYMGELHVTLPSGDTYTSPNDGYLEISVEESLVTAGGNELVSITDAKEVLNIPSTDRSRDAKVLRFIRATRPTIEAITGPIVPTLYEEWHDGGQTSITLRRRPSSAYGTTPLLQVQAISEYNGPIEWPLSIVSSPDHGQMYSVHVDKRLGKITRRTAGGGVQPFPNMPESVHVWYTAGQSTIPHNVYEATLELLRVNFQQTQQQAGLRVNANTVEVDDETPQRAPLGFFVPGRVREMLSPNRRYPSLA